MSICDMIGPILYADELNTRIIVLHFRLMGSVRGPVHRSEILTISIDSCRPWFAE